MPDERRPEPQPRHERGTDERYAADLPYVGVSPARARELIAGGVAVIDVREPSEYATGHIPGARLVPLGTLLAKPRAHLSGDATLFVCAVGARSALACELAASVGVTDVYNLEGGTVSWTAAGLPIER